MILSGGWSKLAVVAAIALSASIELGNWTFDGAFSNASSVWAQEGGRRGGRNWGRFLNNMTAERFEQIKSGPRAEQIKNRVGEEQWAKWESGDFSKTAAQEAAQAQDAAEGKVIDTEMTEEEIAEAEALLEAGTVPDFNFEGEPKFSIETEAEYYAHSMARRDDTLVAAAPLTLRFYVRYLMSKYDANGNGILEQPEWEDKMIGAQAVDLDGDWNLNDQELLYYLTRYAKDRTLMNPNPPQFQKRQSNLIVGDQETEVVIRTASAAPRRVTEEEAQTEREANDGSNDLSDMTDEEIQAMMKENNPAMESVEDDELLNTLLTDMDESSAREYAASPAVVRGVPVWFLARDRNGDGQLTLREFAPNLSMAGVAQFGKLDANGDGLIVVDEIRAALGNNNAGNNNGGK